MRIDPRIHREDHAGARRVVLLTLLVVAIALPARLHAQSPAPPYTAAVERIDSLIRLMTLDEKLTLLHGTKDPEPAIGLGSAGYMGGVPRLGIPPLRLTDGPAGIRTSAPATALPAPAALAASFDTSLARQYGAVLGHDALARNQDVVLAPMVNIVRVPQAGRNFETLGEDPLLASRMVASEIDGIQGSGAMATVKHFAANNFENGRNRVDARVGPRALNEIYLPAFMAAVRSGVAAVMCSYNRVNGQHACASRNLLTDILRHRAGFNGWVMTDWFATHDLASLSAGLDQEMPGYSMGEAGIFFTDSLRAAVQAGIVREAVVDSAVRHILVQMDRFGLLSGTARSRPPIDTVAEAAVARDVAEKGAVLLRNNGVLPLSIHSLGSVVVIGPTAKTPLVGGGGSAHVLPFHTVSLLSALGRRAKSPVQWLPGFDLDGEAVPAAALGSGLMRDGGVRDAQIDFTDEHALPAASSWTWTGTLTAPETGDYELKLHTNGAVASLILCDTMRVVVGSFGTGSLIPTADGLMNTSATVHLTAGRAVPIRLTADGRTRPFGEGDSAAPVQIRFAWSTPAHRRALLDAALSAARRARTVVVVAYDEETEGHDRSSLSLPERQNALISALARANPRTVVVLNTGNAVEMPWVQQVAAVLEMWYPGQEGGDATARLLLGEANPGGKLPVTFPRTAADAATSDRARYPGVNLRADYNEGNLVGYRWYDAKQIAPLFPFGHGLSYTRFDYSGLRVRPNGDGFDVSFRVRNAGTLRGTEAAQVYLAAPKRSAVPMPPQQLVGFTRVELAPGEARSVSAHLNERALSYWSTAQNGWQVAAGAREVRVGSSSRDIRLRGIINVAETRSRQANVDAHADSVRAQMTLAEKIGQMTQPAIEFLQPSDIEKYHLGSILSGGDSDPADGNSVEAWTALYERLQRHSQAQRLRIPLLYGIDAVHGNNNLLGAVIFPHNIGLGATRDTALVRRVGEITAREVRATGIQWAFGPCVCVPQDIRWGRTYEGFSEDPALTAAMGVAALRGLQGTHLSQQASVLADPKHFLADGGTAFGSGSSGFLLDQGDTRIDAATLQRIHLAPYRAAIDAGARAIMVSFSSWNGVKLSASKYLLTDVLKHELGFKGFLVSDWGALYQVDPDYKTAIEKSINAGMDMVMVPDSYPAFVRHLTDLVNEGRVPMSRIDDAVHRILRVKFEMGLTPGSQNWHANPALQAEFGSAAHRAVARRAVRQSLVLLKNAHATLPLSKHFGHIVVAGKGADDIGMQTGGWTITWQGASGQTTSGGTTILAGIRQVTGPETLVTYSRDGSNAAGADVAIAVIGETPYAEGKGDRSDLSLDSADVATVRHLKAAGMPVVVVLISGRPIILGPVLDMADAFVAAWLPGTEGAGVSDVLFGDYAPTGKLSYTWPRSMDQLPLRAGKLDGEPLFPFGFGLTYHVRKASK